MLMGVVYVVYGLRRWGGRSVDGRRFWVHGSMLGTGESKEKRDALALPFFENTRVEGMRYKCKR